jgi:LuxR family maltose regulon positive regulatory protein
MTPDGMFELAFPAESPRASPSAVPEALRHSGVPLSACERMIVRLMGHGLCNKRIARQLSIAPETVASHAKHIFWKLEVRTRAQAVHRAWALGLIAPDQGMG